MTENILLIEGKQELLGEVQELWQKLNMHHMENTQYFKKKYQENSFEKRKKPLLEKSATGDIQVLIAKDQATDTKAGYCISTVTAEGIGELDSIYVEKEYRRLGVGDMLMTASMKWLESKAPKEIVLTVAGGNEKALDFYKRYGFYTTATKLAKVNEKTVPEGKNFGRYFISADKSLLHLDDIVALISKSYWAPDRSREDHITSIENSICFGVYDGDKQIGFARIITDYATQAYLADVIIDENYRGQGIGKALVGFIMEYKPLQKVKSWSLLTKDAHTLYEKFGYGYLEDPKRYMRRSGFTL